MRPCIVDVMGLDGLAGLDYFLFSCLVLPPLTQQASDPLKLTLVRCSCATPFSSKKLRLYGVEFGLDSTRLALACFAYLSVLNACMHAYVACVHVCMLASLHVCLSKHICLDCVSVPPPAISFYFGSRFSHIQHSTSALYQTPTPPTDISPP